MEFTKEQEALIQKEIERLRGADDAALSAWNEDSAGRRISWFLENRNSFQILSGDPVDAAYRLLLARFRIPPKEAPIVSRTDRGVTFHSQNFCPTLEACRRLGLDTRHVCRLYNEEATNRLIQQIDPRLRFSRNYDNLRPYAKYCEECITLEGL